MHNNSNNYMGGIVQANQDFGRLAAGLWKIWGYKRERTCDGLQAFWLNFRSHGNIFLRLAGFFKFCAPTHVHTFWIWIFFILVSYKATKNEILTVSMSIEDALRFRRICLIGFYNSRHLTKWKTKIYSAYYH